MGLYIGYDVGSISINRAIIDEKGKIVEILPYTRHLGESVKSIKNDIRSICAGNYKNNIAGIGFTGSGGKEIASLLGLDFINEIEALYREEYKTEELKVPFLKTSAKTGQNILTAFDFLGQLLIAYQDLILK